MIHELGDMWSIYDETDAFCVPTNSILKSDGRLVMGSGLAKQVRDRIIGVDRIAGNLIRSRDLEGKTYGILNITPPGQDRPKIIAFQSKRHWRFGSDLDVIEFSAEKLAHIANKHQDRRFDLAFPGIGCGCLDDSDVLPCISILPNNVHVWKFKAEDK